MLPDWIHLAVEFGAPAVSALAAAMSGAYRLGRQDRAAEQANADMLDEVRWLSKTVRRMAKRSGSDPPPRGRLPSLQDDETDPFSLVMAEYQKRTDPEDLTPTDPATPASKRWKTGG